MERGETDEGIPFFAARARASVRLHRAKVEVTSRPGVAKDRSGAVDAALEACKEALGPDDVVKTE